MLTIPSSDHKARKAALNRAWRRRKVVGEARELLRAELDKLSGLDFEEFRSGVVATLLDLPFIHFAGKCKNESRSPLMLDGSEFSRTQLVYRINRFPPSDREGVARKLIVVAAFMGEKRKPAVTLQPQS